MVKKIGLLLLLLLCAGAESASNYVWVVIESDNEQAGTVSASKTNTTTSMPNSTFSATWDKQVSLSSNTAVYVYAKPNDGYKLDYWEVGSSTSEGTDIIKDNVYKGNQYGGWTSLTTPVLYTKSVSSRPTNYLTIKAHWTTSSAPTTVDLTFAKPVGGSYTLKTEGNSVHSINTTMYETSSDYEAKGISMAKDWVSVYATAKRGYKFVGWYLGTTLLTTEQSWYNKNYSTGGTVTAKFEAETAHDVTFTAPNDFTGGIYKILYKNKDAEGKDWSRSLTLTPSSEGDAVISLYPSDKVTLTAYSQRGNVFKHWAVYVGENTDVPAEIKDASYTEATTIEPYFYNYDPCYVTYQTATNGSYTVTYTYDDVDGDAPVLQDGKPVTHTITERNEGVETYESDDIVLTAKADEGYAFKGWYKDGELWSRDATLSCHIPAKNCHVNAAGDYVCDGVTIKPEFTQPFNLTFADKPYGITDANIATITVKKGETALTLPATETDVKPTDAYTVTCTIANSNYELLGWYYKTSPEAAPIYVSRSSATKQTITVPEAGTVYADVVAKTSDFVFSTASGVRYEGWTNAFNSAADVLILCNDRTLSSNFTIPEGKTLLIPYDTAGTVVSGEPEVIAFNGTVSNASWTTPSAYKTLTLGEDVTLTVLGSLEVGAQMLSTTGKYPCGAPAGKYGHIALNSGSKIVIGDGSNASKLYCWGYITGSGSVEIKSKSQVYEGMQIVDFRGGTCISGMLNNTKKVFPMNQYYIQNIESNLEIQAGAKEYVTSNFYFITVTTAMSSGNILLIGDENSSAMFKLGTSAKINRQYDATKDYTTYNVFGNVELGEIAMDLVGYSFSSGKYVLPVANNMIVNVGDANTKGNVTINKEAALLPGAQLNVAAGSELTIGENGKVYVYDGKVWTWCPTYKDIHRYSPTWGTTCPRKYDASPINPVLCASMQVNGTVNVNGGLYTTYKTGSTTAAQITSTGNGKIVFGQALSDDALSDGTTYMEFAGKPTYTSIPYTSAQLLNGDGTTYVSTSSLNAGDIVKYSNNVWAKVVDPVTVYKEDGNTDIQAATDCNWTNIQASDPNAIAVTTSSAFATGKNNVIVKSDEGYNCSNLVIQDGHDFKAPVAFSATNVTYYRTSTSTWGTVCMPFALTSGSDIQYYKLNNVVSGSTSKLEFVAVDNVAANEPAVYQLISGSFSIDQAAEVAKGVAEELSEKNPTVDGWKLVGTTVKEVLPTTGEGDTRYYISGGKFWNFNQSNNGKVAINPFRAYFQGTTINGTQQAPSRLEIAIFNRDGMVTDLGEIGEDGELHMDKFLKDGKLYIRKNGHVFNAAGQVVK